MFHSYDNMLVYQRVVVYNPCLPQFKHGHHVEMVPYETWTDDHLQKYDILTD